MVVVPIWLCKKGQTWISCGSDSGDGIDRIRLIPCRGWEGGFRPINSWSGLIEVKPLQFEWMILRGGAK